MNSNKINMSKYDKVEEDRTWRKLDLQLDIELEESFPASDPPKITRNRECRKRKFA
jgi:hypothetical protein